MRTPFVAQLVAASLSLGAAFSAEAQGSWLPYGTLGASDVAVSPAGVVWLIGKEPKSIRSTLILGETQFVTPLGSPAHVAVDLNGFPWLLNSDGSVWRFVRNSAGHEDWIQSPLKAIDIAVGANGAVWAIDTEQHIVQLKNGAWESIGGAGVRIAVDPSGKPWVVNATGQVSHWTGNVWAEIPASATDISVAPDGSVFILGTKRVRGGFEVLRLNGSTWEELVGGGGVAISAGSKAVFVAQDTTTYLVLSSTNARLGVAGVGASTGPTTSATSTPVPRSGESIAVLASAASTVSPTSANNPEETRKSAGATAETASGDGKGTSIPLPSAGTVVGALGLLGGLVSRAAPAVVPVPIPSPSGVAQAAAGAAAGAAVSTVAGAAGNALGGAIGKAVSSAAAGSPPSSGMQTSNGTQSSPGKMNPPEESRLSAVRPLAKLPIPGNLRCPIIGGGALMERGCELIGRAAMKLSRAPSTDCTAPAFADSRNGGECWTCPTSFTRGSTPVDAADACVGPGSQRSVATLVKGCATYNAPPGYGTPFRDSPNGSECWVCPFPLQRSWSVVTSLTKGNLSACFGKAKELLVWQLGQYPEAGSYRFMPGLLSIALADPKAVDAFLDKRANGDTVRKREMWAEMIADPSSSAELKALLFASLLSVAKQDSANTVARDALHEFESYVQTRRAYVADEALRMYNKAREIDTYYEQAKDSANRIRSEAVETAATDFKTYAWSSVVPDSAGTAFILASAALSQLGASGGAPGVADAAISSLNVRYLEPVTKALEDELDLLQDRRADMIEKAGTLQTIANGARALKGADPAMISTTLLGAAVKVSKGVMSLFGKDEVAAEYEKYVEEMSVPVRIRNMLESTNPEDRQTLLLYWALATSPHKASDKIGTSAMTGAELCNSDSWTAAECSSAKSMILAAAKAAGYSN